MKFYIWLPAFDDLAHFKDMGVDGVVYNQRLNPRTVRLVDLEQRCDQLGLELWRYPDSEMEGSQNSSKLAIGYTLLDEPVLHGWTPEQWASQRATRPLSLPVLGNLEGDKFSKDIASMRQSEIDTVRKFVNIPDITLCDGYGWARVRYNADHSFLSWYGIDLVLKAFKVMQAVATAGKQLGIVVDSGNQNIDINSRAPTVQEFRGQLWAPFLLGATHAMLFPQRPGSSQTLGKTPMYETWGTIDNAIPPELELEFRLSKSIFDQIRNENWHYDGFTETANQIVANFSGGKSFIYDKTTYNVSYFFGGREIWKLDNQSQYRKYSSTPYPEQLIAQQKISSMSKQNVIASLQKRNTELTNGLKSVMTILQNLGVSS